MLEIILDGNPGNTFLQQEYPVAEVVPSSWQTFDDYRREARRIIENHANENAVIIPENEPRFSINKLAVALFIESCEIPNRLDYAVFKVSDYKQKTEAYKPYCALTIAIKYIMRLLQDDPKTAYKDMACLGYLGLNIKQDYANDRLLINLPGKIPLPKITASDFSEALIAIGIAKALTLEPTGDSLEIEINTLGTDTSLSKRQIINEIVNRVIPLIETPQK